ncbi:MAG: hypothetical protein WBC15_12090 [Mycobacterium sp.]
MEVVDVGLPESALERWFDRMLRDGMAVTLTGDYAPFPAAAKSALSVIAGSRLSGEQVRYVLDGLATLPARDVGLVAVHAFDCHGAHAAGLTTGWARRLERHYPDIFTPADVIGDDLVEVASGLIALQRA